MRAARGHRAALLSQRECDLLPVGAPVWLTSPGRCRRRLRVAEHAGGHAVGVAVAADGRRLWYALDDVREGGQVVTRCNEPSLPP